MNEHMNEQENNKPVNELEEQKEEAVQPEQGTAASDETAAADVPTVTAAQDEPKATEPAPKEAEPTVIYRWEYAEQAAADARSARKTRRGGVLTFAIVMSVCFGLTLLLLVGSLLAGGFDFAVPNVPDDGVVDGNVEDDPAVQPPADNARPGTLPEPGTSSTQPDPDIPYGQGNLEISDGDAEALSLQQISAKGNQVVVAISVRTPLGAGSGTGIIMTEDGYIATNHHVIEDATSITVLLYDGREYEATLIGSSQIDDLAVIKIDETDLPTATFGDSADVLVGDRAVVIGHPAGLEFGWTSTYGYISAINRNVKIRDYDGTMTKRMTVLQTDADVNSGNSGGPLFNNRGEVIGIITMKLAGDYEGMGFAIPSNGAVPLLEALMKSGTTDGVESEVSSARPVLGITGVSVVKDQYYVLGEGRIIALTEEQAASTEGSFKAAATGVLITDVSATADAYEKLLAGDIVTAMNGKTMADMNVMREYLYNLRIGDTVTITYLRDGTSHDVDIRLIEAEQ